MQDDIESNWYRGPARETTPGFPVTGYVLHASWQVLMVVLIALLAYAAIGCVHAPSYAAAPRNRDARLAAQLDIEVSCGDLPAGDDFGSVGRRAHAVMIGPRHALTALHVVECAAIPTIVATMPDGHRVYLAVDREWPAASGDGVARLVVATAEWFPVAPPVVGEPDHGLLELRTTRPGDSGLPEYNRAGELVGVVTNGAVHVSQLAEYVGGKSAVRRFAKLARIEPGMVCP